MVGFSILFLLSVLLKPSFYQFFAFAGTLYTVAFFLRKASVDRFKYCLKVAAAFLPATIWTLYNMHYNVGSFALSPFTCILINNETAAECVISIVSGIAFPLFVLIVSIIKKNHSKMLCLAWLCYMIALLEFLLFIEPAEIGSLNMSYGYICAMYILFIYSAVEFERMRQDKRISAPIGVMGGGLFMWHALVGLYAFGVYSSSYYSII